MKRLVILAAVLLAMAVYAAPAEARWFPGKLLGRAVVNGVERRQARRADGRGLARLFGSRSCAGGTCH